MRIRGEEMVQVWAQILIFETRPLMLSANVNKKTISNIFLRMTRPTHVLIYFFSKIKTVGDRS